MRVARRLCLELGAGFHPALSGRENIYLNASVLGVPKTQIDERVEQIIEFAGLEEFIDSPVKIYSSGMYVRLGFAVAVHVDPEVLIVDEVVAVGDEEFQLRCFSHLEALRAQGCDDRAGQPRLGDAAGQLRSDGVAEPGSFGRGGRPSGRDQRLPRHH